MTTWLQVAERHPSGLWLAHPSYVDKFQLPTDIPEEHQEAWDKAVKKQGEQQQQATHGSARGTLAPKPVCYLC